MITQNDEGHRLSPMYYLDQLDLQLLCRGLIQYVFLYPTNPTESLEGACRPPNNQLKVPG